MGLVSDYLDEYKRKGQQAAAANQKQTGGNPALTSDEILKKFDKYDSSKKYGLHNEDYLARQKGIDDEWERRAAVARKKLAELAEHRKGADRELTEAQILAPGKFTRPEQERKNAVESAKQFNFSQAKEAEAKRNPISDNPYINMNRQAPAASDIASYEELGGDFNVARGIEKAIPGQLGSGITRAARNLGNTLERTAIAATDPTLRLGLGRSWDIPRDDATAQALHKGADAKMRKTWQNDGTVMNRWLKPLEDELNKWSDMENAGIFAQMAGGAAGSAPEMILTQAMTAGVPLLGSALMYNSAFNSTVEEQMSNYTAELKQARESGDKDLAAKLAAANPLDDPNTWIRAVGSGLIEVATERTFNLFSGTKGVADALTKKGLKGFTPRIVAASKGFVDSFLKDADKLVAPTLGNFLGYLGKKGAEEGFEEIMADLGNGFLAKLTTDKDTALNELITLEGLAVSFGSGALMGSVASAVNGSRQFKNTKAYIENLSGLRLDQITSEHMARLVEIANLDMEDNATRRELLNKVTMAVENGGQNGRTSGKPVPVEVVHNADTNQNYQVQMFENGSYRLVGEDGKTTINLDWDEYLAGRRVGMFTETDINPFSMFQQQATPATDKVIDTDSGQKFDVTGPALGGSRVFTSEDGKTTFTVSQDEYDYRLASRKYKTIINQGSTQAVATPATEMAVDDGSLPIQTDAALSDDTTGAQPVALQGMAGVAPSMAQSTTAQFQAKDGKSGRIDAKVNGKNGTLVIVEPGSPRQYRIEFEPDVYAQIQTEEEKRSYLLAASSEKGSQALYQFAAKNVSLEATGDFYSSLVATADAAVSQRTMETDAKTQETVAKAIEKDTIALEKKTPGAMTDGDIKRTQEIRTLAREAQKAAVERGEMDGGVFKALSQVDADMAERGIDGFMNVASEASLQRVQKDMAKIIETEMGKKVVFVTMIGVDAVNEFVNDFAKDTVFVNANRSEIGTAWAIGHGLHHLMVKDGNGDIFTEAVKQFLPDGAVDAYLDQYNHIPEHRKHLQESGLALEEIVADRAGDIFTNPQFWKTLAVTAPTSKRAKILDRVSKFFERVSKQSRLAQMEIMAMTAALEDYRTEMRRTDKAEAKPVEKTEAKPPAAKAAQIEESESQAFIKENARQQIESQLTDRIYSRYEIYELHLDKNVRNDEELHAKTYVFKKNGKYLAIDRDYEKYYDFDIVYMAADKGWDQVLPENNVTETESPLPPKSNSSSKPKAVVAPKANKRQGNVEITKEIRDALAHVSKGTGGVAKVADIGLRNDADIETLEKVQEMYRKATGGSLVYYEHDGRMHIGGFTSPENTSIVYVNITDSLGPITARDLVFVTGHEFYHVADKMGLGKEFLDITLKARGLTRDKLLVQLRSDLGYKPYYDHYAKRGYSKTEIEDVVIAEYVANNAGTVFADRQFWEAIHETNKTLFDKFIDWLKTVLQYTNIKDGEVAALIKVAESVKAKAEAAVEAAALPFDPSPSDPANVTSYSISKKKLEQADLSDKGKVIATQLFALESIQTEIRDELSKLYEASKKPAFKNGKPVMGNDGNQKMVGFAGLSPSQFNVHNINMILEANKPFRQRLLKIQNDSKAAGVFVDFVTDDGYIKASPIETAKLSKPVKGEPQTRKEQVGVKMWAFWRGIPQSFIDELDYSAFEDLRKSLVDLTERTYAANKEGKRLGGFPAIFPAKGQTLGQISTEGLKGIQPPLRHAEKTWGALSLNSLCPMFTVGNNGCWLDGCYLTQMANGATGVNLFKTAMYTGEILQLSNEEIKNLNSTGGLRINGVGDTTDSALYQWADVLKHAGMRGLNIKIITKQMATFEHLAKIKRQGIAIDHVIVQPSLDNLWSPAALDEYRQQHVRGGMQSSNLLSETVTSGRFEAAEVGYEELYGRETKIVDGVLYRKYGFSEQQLDDMRKRFPEVKVTPRYVVANAKEIAELALHKDVSILTLMHGKVEEGLISDFEGNLINFGAYRHLIGKDKNGWYFTGVQNKTKEVVQTAAHREVEQYIKNNYSEAEQETIFERLQKLMCCQSGTTVDACMDCAAHGAVCSNRITLMDGGMEDVQGAKVVAQQTGGTSFSIDKDLIPSSVSDQSIRTDLAKIMASARKAGAPIKSNEARDILDIMLYAKTLGETLSVGEAVAVREIYSDNGIPFDSDVPAERLKEAISIMRNESDFGEIEPERLASYGDLFVATPVQLAEEIDRQAISDEGVRFSLEKRLSGDAILNAQDAIDEIKAHGGSVDANGYVTVYHRTSKANADLIKKTGIMRGKEDGLFFSTAESGQADGFGDTVVAMKIPVERLQIDDVFDKEVHLRLPTKTGAPVTVKPWLNNDTQFSINGIKPGDGEDAHRMNRIFLVETFGKDFVDALSREDLVYDVQSNLDTAKMAADLLQSKPKLALARAMNPQSVGAVDTVLRFYYMWLADKNGDFREAARWAHIANKANLGAGQAIQAVSIFEKLSPEATLMYAEKQIIGALSEQDRKKFELLGKQIADEFENLDAEAVKALRLEIEQLKKMLGVASDENAALEATVKLLEDRIKELEENGAFSDGEAVKDFLDALHGVAAATIPFDQLPKSKDPTDFMKWAVKNKDKMGEAWKTAWQIARNLKKHDPVYLAELDAYFGPFVPGQPGWQPTELSDEMLDRIRKSLVAHYSEDYRTFQAMVKRLIDLGVDPKDAVLIGREAQRQIDRLTRKKKYQALRRVLPKHDRSTEAALMEIVNAANERGLLDVDVQNWLQKKYGLPGLTGDLIMELSGLAREIGDINQQAAMDGRKLTYEEDRKVKVNLGLIQARIQQQIPVKLSAKIDLFQSIMMMSGFLSAERNIISNTLFGTIDTLFKDYPAAAIDHALAKMSGRRAVPLPRLGDMLRAAKRGAKESAEDIRLGINTRDMDVGYQTRGQTFKSKPGQALYAAFRYKMELPDRFAQSGYYESHLNGLMELAGVTEPTDAMIEAAEYFAQKKTFADDNAASSSLSFMRELLNNFYSPTYWKSGRQTKRQFGLGSMIIKFPKVPGALMMRTLEYSPLNTIGVARAAIEFAKPIYEMKRYGITGFTEADMAKTQRKLANAIAETTFGTAVTVALGMWLAGLGLISGAGDDDKDKKELEQTAGVGRGYQVNWTGLWRWVRSGFDPDAAQRQEGDFHGTYIWLAPLSVGMAIGANIVMESQDVANLTVPAYERWWNYAIKGLTSGLDSITELTAMSGLRGFIENFQYTDSFAEGLFKSTIDVPSSFIPAVSRQLRNITDNSIRATYSADPFRYAYQLVLNRLPGASKTLAPTADALGNLREVHQNNGNNVWNVFFNPAWVSRYQPNEAATIILNAMAEAEGTEAETTNIMPRKIPRVLNYKINGVQQPLPLTDEERFTLQREISQSVTDQFKTIPSNWPIEDKVKRMNEILNKTATDALRFYQATKRR